MFLVTAGFRYYPNSGNTDWIGIYATEERAKEVAESVRQHKDAPDWCEVIELKEFHNENPYCFNWEE